LPPKGTAGLARLSVRFFRRCRHTPAPGQHQRLGAVNDMLVVSAPEPESQWHTVVSGDNLSKIAKKFYGDANKYPLIFEANKPMLKHPDKIYPGQLLRIPGA
jgi:nucleoid-associated protein YgaU